VGQQDDEDAPAAEMRWLRSVFDLGTQGDEEARMKIIMTCEPDEAPDLLALIVRHLPDFETSRGPGWGWVHNLPSGKAFFLRSLKDGISATPVRKEAR